jgi:putative transcriptional regulator
MKSELFEELVKSVRQGGKILRKQEKPSRSFRFKEPKAAAVRRQYGLSQQEFAAMLGISVRTLQNWEQGRRSPQGPARVLLRVAAEHPDAVWDAIRKAS